MNKINERINKNNDLVNELSRFFRRNVLFFTDKMLKQSGFEFLRAGLIAKDYYEYQERYDYIFGETYYEWNDGYDFDEFTIIKHCAKPLEEGWDNTIFITDYIFEDLKMIKGADIISPKDLEELLEDYSFNYDDKFMNSIEFINYCYDLIQDDIIKYLEYDEKWNNIDESSFKHYFRNEWTRETYSLHDIDDDVEAIYKEYTEIFNKYKKEGDVIKPMFVNDIILFNNIELVNRI